MTAVTANSAAAKIARMGTARGRKIREFVTPEGVDLRLEIASSGLRFAALMIDLILVLLIMILVILILDSTSLAQGDTVIIIAMLVWFLISNFWFALFELGPRAATPGKRIVGIRVVARDGGQLTVAAVVARNLVRQMEILLPVMFIFGSLSADLGSVGTSIAGLLWTLGFGFFLLFNKDRMRLGDVIGGTWVVMAKRKRMAPDMASAPLADAPGVPVFTEAELAIYGVYELQELERVLRQRDRDTMIAVADAIRGKLGRSLQEASSLATGEARGKDDRLFLIAYYRQLKVHQERNLLFGKRRASKYEALQ